MAKISSEVLLMKRPICIGIIGGGQLGKMIAQEAKRMSFRVIILDPDDQCSASSVSDEQIVADFKDENAIRELASKSDVLTYEIELANSSALKDLQSKKYPIYPSPEILAIIQNKYRQKSFLKDNDIAVPKFDFVDSEDHLRQLCASYGFPAMLKVCQDSYDGRGNFLIRSKDKIHEAFAYFEGKECMLEKYVPYLKEISIIVARNSAGQIESFPVGENIHNKGILDMTIVPARISKKTNLRAKKMAEKTMQAMKGAGIFGIEMFVMHDENVLINEIAPRPHNSGHYSIEACSISQFEQHLRAILNLPLSKPELLCPAVMMNILGPANQNGPYAIKGLKNLFLIQGLKLHVYGKKVSKPRRKLGHITVTANTIEKALSRAKRARKMIKLVVNQNI
jgi:5-(carboxyamino)imidazole ribonucleotide synthase